MAKGRATAMHRKRGCAREHTAPAIVTHDEFMRVRRPEFVSETHECLLQQAMEMLRPLAPLSLAVVVSDLIAHPIVSGAYRGEAVEAQH